MKLEPLKLFIFKELDDKLPKHYYYHNTAHTLQVMQTAEALAKMEKVEKHQLLLLQTAALMHDTGLMFGRENHEAQSVMYLHTILPEYDYSAEVIDHISEMVMATKMPQNPQDLLAKLLCDADLDYLGTKNYFMQSHQLRLEWLEENLISEDLKEWYQYQVHFLSTHRYFTNYGTYLRQKIKEENLENIRLLLSS